MKTLTFLLTFLSITTFAQDSLWVEYTIPYDSGIVNDLFYVDTITAWAVGRNTETDNAVIMHSNDGFNNLTIQDESLTGNLNAIFMKNPQLGFAVGQNWNNGQIAILKTENGSTWINQTLPSIFGSLNDVVFTTGLKSFAVGVNYTDNPSTALIIYTEDGATWQEASYPELNNIFLSEVTFSSEDEGWCIGSTLGDVDSTFILYSGDGGLNWQKVIHPILIGAIEGMNFISPDSAIFYGQAADTAFMMLTPDKGQSWEFISVNEDEPDQVPVKSTSELNEACKESVVGAFISYVDYDFFPYFVTIYGWRVVAYKNCPTGKRFELQRVALLWAANGQKFLKVLEKTEMPDLLVTKGVMAPSQNNDIKPLNPVITVAGLKVSSNKPVIKQSKMEFLYSINESDTIRTLVIDLIGSGKAIICVNDKEEITVNGVSTGVTVNDVSKVEINGFSDKSEIDASCITNQNRGSISGFEINAGSGEGPNKINGPEASEIVTHINSTNGYTEASGGNGRGIYQVGNNIENNDFPTMLTYDHMGNETYLNNTFSHINDSPLKKGSIKNIMADLPTNSYTDDEGNDTLKYLNYGWPVKINLDSQSVAQQISEVQNLILNGQFENLIGSTFDDKITVKPLIDEPRFIDGGTHVQGDTLIFDALGKEVADDGSSLLVEGYLPVNYINIENLIIINTPGPLFRIEITPLDTVIDIGEQVQFTAQGFDEQGLTVSITPEWTATGGTITTEGLFTAGTEAGSFKITATIDEISNEAEVVISAGALFRIVISPSSVELETGSQQQFSATGFDQFDNEVVIEPEWTTTGGAITNEGLFTAGDTEGTFYVYASSGEVVGEASVIINIPTNVSFIEAQDNKIKLLQNYPNPFNKSTNIKYIIPSGAEFESGIHVLLNVYDFSGQKVKTLVNKKQRPGSFLIEFNSSSIKYQLPAGIYHYQLNVDGRYFISKKMMLK